MTNLELVDGRIALVHWFDVSLGRKTAMPDPRVMHEIPGTPFRRIVLKEDSLNYIFTRIRLLAAAYEPRVSPKPPEPFPAARLWLPEHLSV